MDAVTPQFITAVAHEVHPGLIVDPSTVAYLQYLVTPYAQAVEQAEALDQLDAWLDVALPGELAKHAKSEVAKAVTKAGEVDDVEKVKAARRGTIVYVLAELIELSGNRARDHGDTTILPWDLKLAIAKDEELETMFKQNDGTDTVVVTVRIGASDSPHAMSEDFVAGILLYYHAAGKDAAVTLYLYGVPLTNAYLLNPDGSRHHEDNAREGEDASNFLVDVGGTTYSFRSPDFLQGAASAAMWLNEDFHTRLTKLRTFNAEGEEHPLTF
jgi:hypothetical protein